MEALHVWRGDEKSKLSNNLRLAAGPAHIKPPDQTTSGFIQYAFFLPPIIIRIKVRRSKDTAPAGMFDS